MSFAREQETRKTRPGRIPAGLARSFGRAGRVGPPPKIEADVIPSVKTVERLFAGHAAVHAAIQDAKMESPVATGRARNTAMRAGLGGYTTRPKGSDHNTSWADEVAPIVSAAPVPKGRLIRLDRQYTVVKANLERLDRTEGFNSSALTTAQRNALGLYIVMKKGGVSSKDAWLPPLVSASNAYPTDHVVGTHAPRPYQQLSLTPQF